MELYGTRLLTYGPFPPTLRPRLAHETLRPPRPDNRANPEQGARAPERAYRRDAPTAEHA